LFLVSSYGPKQYFKAIYANLKTFIFLLTSMTTQQVKTIRILWFYILCDDRDLGRKNFVQNGKTMLDVFVKFVLLLLKSLLDEDVCVEKKHVLERNRALLDTKH
jgi:hypothetical protein